MAAATLREQLNAHIDSMYTSGMVDEEFEQLQMLQDDRSSPGFFAEVVTLFHDAADRIIIEQDVVFKSSSLGNELYRVYKVDLICSGIRIVRREQPTVDFDKVDAYMHQLKGSSTSAGAQKVKFTCIQFRQDKNRDGDMHCCVLVFPLVMLKLKHKMKMRYTGSSLGDILLEDLLKETITY